MNRSAMIQYYHEPFLKIINTRPQHCERVSANSIMVTNSYVNILIALEIVYAEEGEILLLSRYSLNLGLSIGTN